MRTRLLALLLILAITITSSAQQSPVPLSKQASAARQKVSTLAAQDKISVIPLHGDEEFGNYLSRDADEFTFFDVDLKRTVTFQYTQIKKVKNGYGGYNFLNQRHVDRTKNLVFAALFAALLGGLLIAVATAKN